MFIYLILYSNVYVCVQVMQLWWNPLRCVFTPLRSWKNYFLSTSTRYCSQSPRCLHDLQYFIPFSKDSFEGVHCGHPIITASIQHYGPCTYGYHCKSYLFLLAMGPLGVAVAQGFLTESDRLQVNLNWFSLRKIILLQMFPLTSWQTIGPPDSQCQPL